MSNKVSVVILNYNGGELTLKAIDSVFNQKGIEVEVIVIDNGSTDGSCQKIEKTFGEKIKLIKNSINMGFAYACNQGFELAEGEWVALLNNDACADPLWLKHSLESAKTSKKIGVIIPKIIRADERDVLDGIGVGFWLDGLSRAKYRGELDSRRFNQDCAVVASGCACIYSKKMVKELAGFDSDFFIYSEDTDLGLKAFLGGWKAVVAPKAIVYHGYSQTTAPGAGYSIFKLYQVERNRIWILLRWYPIYLILLSPFLSFIRLSYQFLQALKIRDSKEGKFWSWIWAFLRAIKDALANFPKQWKIRKHWLKGNAKKEIKNLIYDQFIPLRKIARLD